MPKPMGSVWRVATIALVALSVAATFIGVPVAVSLAEGGGDWRVAAVGAYVCAVVALPAFIARRERSRDRWGWYAVRGGAVTLLLLNLLLAPVWVGAFSM